jgi:hypothetical protein
LSRRISTARRPRWPAAPVTRRTGVLDMVFFLYLVTKSDYMRLKRYPVKDASSAHLVTSE